MARNWIEVAGFAAFALNVAGNWLLTAKKPNGWWVRIWANVAQLVYACLLPSPSLALNAVTFTVLNVLGAWRWKRTRGHSDTCRVGHTSSLLRPATLVCNCGRFA